MTEHKGQDKNAEAFSTSATNRNVKSNDEECSITVNKKREYPTV